MVYQSGISSTSSTAVSLLSAVIFLVIQFIRRSKNEVGVSCNTHLALRMRVLIARRSFGRFDSGINRYMRGQRTKLEWARRWSRCGNDQVIRYREPHLLYYRRRQTQRA
jgi:hypothetical protein